MIPDNRDASLADSNLAGMSAAAAKDYILAHITQVKLNEKETAKLEAEAGAWKARAALARSRSESSLASEAENRAETLLGKASALRGENAGLQAQIGRMRRQIPGLAARERSVDPDLLLQELLITAGRNPGGEEDAVLERNFAALEKNAAADAALAALKTKMAGGADAEHKDGAS
jgi:phage shock protein A